MERGVLRTEWFTPDRVMQLLADLHSCTGSVHEDFGLVDVPLFHWNYTITVDDEGWLIDDERLTVEDLNRMFARDPQAIQEVFARILARLIELFKAAQEGPEWFEKYSRDAAGLLVLAARTITA